MLFCFDPNSECFFTLHYFSSLFDLITVFLCSLPSRHGVRHCKDWRKTPFEDCVFFFSCLWSWLVIWQFPISLHSPLRFYWTLRDPLSCTGSIVGGSQGSAALYGPLLYIHRLFGQFHSPIWPWQLLIALFLFSCGWASSTGSVVLLRPEGGLQRKGYPCQ